MQIELQNVGLAYPKTGTVLSDVHIQIPAHDLTVLLGPSGSGKSTLLKMIAGLETGFTGSLQRTVRQNEIGFVFQEPHLMPWRTLIENVSLPLELENRLSKNEILSASREALSKVGLAGNENLYPHELSGGMKMRGSLARALVAQPKLLLLDEPFAALDEQTRFKLSEDLRRLWATSDLTVVFVTHSVHEACYLAERILTLAGRPARIDQEIKVNLPHERSNGLRVEAAFTHELKRIYSLLEKKSEAPA